MINSEGFILIQPSYIYIYIYIYICVCVCVCVCVCMKTVLKIWLTSFVISIASGCLCISWSVCISKSQRNLCISLSSSSLNCVIMNNLFFFKKGTYKNVFQIPNELNATRNYLIKEYLHRSFFFQKWKNAPQNSIYDLTLLKSKNWKWIYNM